MPARPAVLSAAADAEILAGVRAGGHARREASRELFRRLREPIHAVCLHVTGRRADAEAAVKEAFVAVHRGLPHHRGTSRLTTWVYRIAMRAAFRARARRRDEERPEGALASLPAGSRAVLSLFAVEGLSHQEIAGILGVPEDAVWTRLQTARRMLVEPEGR